MRGMTGACHRSERAGRSPGYYIQGAHGRAQTAQHDLSEQEDSSVNGGQRSSSNLETRPKAKNGREGERVISRCTMR